MAKATNKRDIEWIAKLEDEDFRHQLSNSILPRYMMSTRWYAAKTQKAKTCRIEMKMPFQINDQETAFFITIEVNFEAGFTEYYFITLALVDSSDQIDDAKGEITPLELNEERGLLIDALYYEPFRKSLYKQILSQKTVTDGNTKILFEKGKVLRSSQNYESSRVLGFDQSNTSIEFNGKYFFKAYRRLFQDANPDLELTKFLSDESDFNNCPKYAGSVSWIKNEYATISIGIMQERIDNIG
jgi:maltose alpha-D-glucosyltransferase/alpha-amylase